MADDGPEAGIGCRVSGVGKLPFPVAALLIVLVSTLIQAPSLAWDEVIDDHDLIHSPTARGCGPNPLDCFHGVVFGLYYRPVLAASFALGERLHGTDRPFPFHLENLLLHAAVVALALWMFRLLFRRDGPALLAGLLFSLHPLQVGVTTFIGGRTDTIALFFLFLFVIGLVLPNPLSPFPPSVARFKTRTVAAFCPCSARVAGKGVGGLGKITSSR